MGSNLGSAGLMLVNTLVNIYAGIRRLLKPGGAFLNANYVRCPDDKTQEVFRRVKRARHA